MIYGIGTSFYRYLPTIILPAIIETIKVLLSAGVLSIIFGLFFGICLYVTELGGLFENKVLHHLLSFITDIVRAFPTMILIVALAPITKAVIGTSIGTGAAIFAITIGCTPFATRMTDNALQTVDPNLIKVATVFGASKFQIIRMILLPEAAGNIVANFTLMLINLLNMTTIAGAVGAGGLGAVALTYGYQRFDSFVMYFIVGILIIFVFLIQFSGEKIYRKLK